MDTLSLQHDERRARTRAGNVGRRGLISFAGTLVVLLGAVSSSLGQPQNPPGDTTYTRAPVFQIPFQPESGERRLKEVQLYVSTDLGQTWKQAVNATPEQRYFVFRAQHDGIHWFSVRTIDLDGKAVPVDMAGARPGLKVYVDTQPPLVHVRALAPRDGELGVEWEIKDDNLDMASIQVDYRVAGSNEWIPIPGPSQSVGQRYWKPVTNGAIEVRVRARDRADNWNEDKTTNNPGGAAAGTPSNSGAPAASGARTTDSGIKLVNSTNIALNYEIKDKGPSGISVVELWYTQDAGARSWQKYREEKGDVHPPFTVDVSGEGLYGFTLIVRSGVGLGDRPPQVGDQPQVWVEVDLTKPIVHVGSVEVGRGPEAGRLAISWTATDKNLGAHSITLSYSEQSGGPWNPIASNVENTGRYIWQMPSGVPYRFHVRVEATDRAGNIGSADTSAPVIVDLAQPKGVILNVEPAAGKSGN
jgi:hypothetical protein